MSDLAHIPALPETAFPLRPRPNVKRHLIAAALSALLPGAGQIFLGRKKKALPPFGVLAAICLGFWVLRLPKSYPGMIFLVWMCFLLSLFSVFGALLGQQTPSSPRMSRWWIFAGIPLHYVGTNLMFTALLLASGFRTLKFASSSMESTLSAGDKFVVDYRYYRSASPFRGDLVLMRTRGFITVKRVIAIGGDKIEGKEREIFVNGELQREPFIQHKFEEGSDPSLDTFGPVDVPAGKYFVMGDNRDISLDSRMSEVGLLDGVAIIGRPLYAYQLFNKPYYRELR